MHTLSIPSSITRLARELEDEWPARLEALRASGVPLNEGTPGAPAGGGGDGGGDDPYDLGSVVNERVPEHLRPYLEPVLGDLRAHLDERVNPLREVHDRYAPLNDRLAPLMEPADPDAPDAGTILDGLLEFYTMTGDENRVDDFMTWWDRVGEEYGFFDDGDGPGEGGEGGQGDPDAPESLEDRMARIEQENEALRSELREGRRESTVDREQTRVQTELSELMQTHNIVDDEQLPEEQRPSTIILRLAATYDGDDAVRQGVEDYLRIIGGGQGQLVQQAGEQTASVGELAGGAPLVGAGVGAGGGGGGGRHGAALDAGRADMEPEPVKSWGDARRIALQRLQQGT